MISLDDRFDEYKQTYGEEDAFTLWAKIRYEQVRKRFYKLKYHDCWPEYFWENLGYDFS